jgi:hypothetical protein
MIIAIFKLAWFLKCKYLRSKNILFTFRVVFYIALFMRYFSDQFLRELTLFIACYVLYFSTFNKCINLGLSFTVSRRLAIARVKQIFKIKES